MGFTGVLAVNELDQLVLPSLAEFFWFCNGCQQFHMFNDEYKIMLCSSSCRFQLCPMDRVFNLTCKVPKNICLLCRGRLSLPLTMTPLSLAF